ncbi:IclR family transcriptional regulator [Nonomuraea sp. M3C6]|uniref:IclR family transcriptional regulator n=1 Tax=Nonomuraea marmarensis TaxID=3351344 RepID=A0ABW7ASJ4_9ACTN
MTIDGDRYVVRSVVRALDILLVLSTQKGPVSLADLAKATGLNSSTAFRLLESLRTRGFVRQADGGSGYQLDSRVVDLGTAFLRSVSIWDYARDLADQLAESVSETANVGVLDQGQVLYIAISRGQRELGIQSQAGTRHPAYCTALGKVFLADLPWDEAEAILDAEPMARLTPTTIVDKAAMRKELETIRSRGYSVDDEERNAHVVCIAAPITDHTGQAVAAVSISGPAFRIREHGIEDLARRLTERAVETSTRMGGAAGGAKRGDGDVR